MKPAALPILTVCLAAGAAVAQSDISPSHKHAWGENVGWMNWRDAGDPDGAQGVEYSGSYLGGYIWGENIGWIRLGDGSPVNGVGYANADNTDYGVNIAPNGVLSGYGWGENVGWINFDTAAELGAFNQHARLDTAANRFRGYAWGENVGWINLDDDEHYVALICRADFNNDGNVNTLDVIAFLNAWVPKLPSADFNGDGTVNTLDVIAFLNAWVAGC